MELATLSFFVKNILGPKIILKLQNQQPKKVNLRQRRPNNIILQPM